MSNSSYHLFQNHITPFVSLFFQNGRLCSTYVSGFGKTSGSGFCAHVSLQYSSFRKRTGRDVAKDGYIENGQFDINIHCIQMIHIPANHVMCPYTNQIYYVIHMIYIYIYPIASMYGIFTYIWLIFYGKCRGIYHTWMVWAYVNIQLTTLISPNDLLDLQGFLQS